MSRKRDVDTAQRVLEHEPGPESDPRLIPGLAHNGESALRASGDYETPIVWVRCGAQGCGLRVGRVVLLNSRERTGRPLSLFVELAVTVDADARPVRQRLTRHLLEAEDGELSVDCPAHGRHLLARSSALDEARATMARLGAGSQRMGNINLR